LVCLFALQPEVCMGDFAAHHAWHPIVWLCRLVPVTKFWTIAHVWQSMTQMSSSFQFSIVWRPKHGRTVHACHRRVLLSCPSKCQCHLILNNFLHSQFHPLAREHTAKKVHRKRIEANQQNWHMDFRSSIAPHHVLAHWWHHSMTDKFLWFFLLMWPLPAFICRSHQHQCHKW